MVYSYFTTLLVNDEHIKFSGYIVGDDKFKTICNSIYSQNWKKKGAKWLIRTCEKGFLTNKI